MRQIRFEVILKLDDVTEDEVACIETRLRRFAKTLTILDVESFDVIRLYDGEIDEA